MRAAVSDELPSVIITGDTSAEEIEDAKLSNCTVFYKPVDIDQLVAHIELVTS